MPRRALTRPLFVGLLLVGGLVPGVVRAQPGAVERQVHPVDWLVGEKSNWSGWAAIRRRMVVEGRYSFTTTAKLRMENCPDLDFVPLPGETLSKPLSSSKTVEVEGRFGMQDDEIVFFVTKVTDRPTDASMFRSRRGDVLRTKPDDWYELAAWAEARARFYDDEALLANAREALEKGVAAERSALKRDDAAGLLALADKVEGFEFSPRLVAELRHAGWRAKWRELLERDEPATAEEMGDFAEGLAKALPGTAQPVSENDQTAAMAKTYRTLPTEAYAEADDAARRLQHRLFHSDVTLKELLLEVDPAARNEEAIAERIMARVPEYADVADALRETALQRELSRVPSMTRVEMSALAGRFRKAGVPARAGKVVEDWLAERERIGREDGADGLLRVADQYESLTSDEDKVASLLIEAHTLRPDSAEAAKRLGKLGYSLRNGKWTTAAAAPPEAGDRGPGGVTVGMSSDQVTAVLGSPRAVSRAATAGQLNEVWIYGPRDAAGFAIHILRDPSRSTDRGRVVRVSERRAR